jgi:hypothetical protein
MLTNYFPKRANAHRLAVGRCFLSAYGHLVSLRAFHHSSRFLCRSMRSLIMRAVNSRPDQSIMVDKREVLPPPFYLLLESFFFLCS